MSDYPDPKAFLWYTSHDFLGQQYSLPIAIAYQVFQRERGLMKNNHLWERFNQRFRALQWRTMPPRMIQNSSGYRWGLRRFLHSYKYNIPPLKSRFKQFNWRWFRFKYSHLRNERNAGKIPDGKMEKSLLIRSSSIVDWVTKLGFLELASYTSDLAFATSISHSL